MANSFYTVKVAPAATAATISHAILSIWNPSSTRTIQLTGISCVVPAAPAAGAGFEARRATARGTAGSTITPTAEHHNRRDAAPDSAFVVDLAAFTVQPTLATGALGLHWVFAAVAASGLILPLARPIEIPPGTGLVMTNVAAVIMATANWGIEVEEL